MREPIFDVDSFARRHIGPNEEEVRAMLRDVGFDSLGALIDATVPKDIRLERRLNLPEAKSEGEALARATGDCTEEQNRTLVHRELATTTASRRLSFSETFLKTLAGTPLTRLTRRKSRKGGSKRC